MSLLPPKNVPLPSPKVATLVNVPEAVQTAFRAGSLCCLAPWSMKIFSCDGCIFSCDQGSRFCPEMVGIKKSARSEDRALCDAMLYFA